MEIDDKLRRITENVFDMMVNSNFAKDARLELNLDLLGHNVYVDKNAGIIEIQDSEGQEVLYRIRFELGPDYLP